MEALAAYIRETGTTPKAFARSVGIEPEHFGRILAGEASVDLSLAQRIVDIAGGAIVISDLLASPAGAAAVVDLRSRLAAESLEIDTDRLCEILTALLPKLVGGSRRAGDEHLPRLAADAAAHTYAALSTVTTRCGPDRLIQALLPVFAEILEDLSAPPALRRQLRCVSEETAALYFQAPSGKKRA